MKSIEKELSVRVKVDRRPKWLRHLCTVHHHRALVRKYCFKLGLYRQGLMHDLSKYSPTEFFVGAKYYQGYRSPNTAERLERGYSSAWLHHKGRNKHHLEYWIDYSLQKDGYPLAGMEMWLYGRRIATSANASLTASSQVRAASISRTQSVCPHRAVRKHGS